MRKAFRAAGAAAASTGPSSPEQLIHSGYQRIPAGIPYFGIPLWSIPFFKV
jgi:hypothetical protein